MRITLVQMRIDLASRASNLSRALRWIDLACAQDPAPDLVVLPGGCDGAAFGPGAPPVSMAMTQVFSQSVALKAKEWGTYVALGFRQPSGQLCASVGVLFDPDGDAIATICAAPPGAAATGLPAPAALTRTPLGCWSLLLAEAPWESRMSACIRDAGARLAVVLGSTPTNPAGPVRARCEQLAREAGVSVCLAAGLSDCVDEPACLVWDARGQLVARGNIGVEEMVRARVAMSSNPEQPTTRHGGDADAPTVRKS